MNPDVVIIGAGIAGLTAAVNLADRGVRVCVLEAKAVLGGRATSFNDPQTGERVDNGQHVLVGCYRETFAFLKKIGTDDRVRMQSHLDVEFVDGTGARSRLQCPLLPPPFNLVAGLLQWEALGWRDRAAALNMARPIRIAQEGQRAEGRGQSTTKIAASPGETVEQWLINNGQTARLREMLWEPLALAALNQSARQAAAPPFARVLAEMFGADPRDAALGLPACPLDELYAEPAREFIEQRGGEVRIGSPARVVLDNGNLSHVEVRGQKLQPGGVICAVPWYAMAEVFAGDTRAVDAIRQAATATAPSPIASVNVWLDRRIMNTPFLGLPGRTMQWVFDKAQMFEANTSHLTLVASGAEQAMSLTNDALIALALHELREALPESRAARVQRASVVRERRASFSLAPGQPARPGTRTNVERVLLAGDWIDTGLPATIEGAALSGRLAAEAIS
jgi:squalene-associated FAD-dependent desaturase